MLSSFALILGLSVASSSWEQRAFPVYPGTRPQSCQGKFVFFSPSNDSGHLDNAWESPDTGRTWNPAPSIRTGSSSWQSFRLGGEEILFEVQKSGGNGRSILKRTDATSSSVVLEGLETHLWIRFPSVIPVGPFLFAFGDSGLVRSADQGRTWGLTSRCLSQQSRRPASCPTGNDDQNSWQVWSTGDNLVTLHANRVWVSSDTGLSWDSLPGKVFNSFQSTVARLPNRSSLVFEDASGPPLEMRITPQGWDTVRMAAGWPLDSLGTPFRSLDVLTFRDTVWALAPRSVHIWDALDGQWKPAPFSLPASTDLWFLDSLQEHLCIGTAEQFLVRGPSGSLKSGPWPRTGIEGGIISTAWHQNELFACSWSRCARSSDSGLTWTDASAGVEGAYVTSMASTPRGLIGSTGNFGLVRWNGLAWNTVGYRGLPTLPDGRYAWIMDFAFHGDTLLFGNPWGASMRWLQAGSNQAWRQADSGTPGVAYGDGQWWGRGPGGQLLSSLNGAGWSVVDRTIQWGIPHQVGQHVVLTAQYGPGVAWREAGVWVADNSIVPAPNGTPVTTWNGGYAVLCDQGVALTGPGVSRSYLPIPAQSTSPWIGAVLGVGNRLFVATTTGLWTRTTAATQATTPRTSRTIRMAGSALQLPGERRYPLEITLFSPTGRRVAALVVAPQDARSSVPLPMTGPGLHLIQIHMGPEKHTLRALQP